MPDGTEITLPTSTATEPSVTDPAINSPDLANPETGEPADPPEQKKPEPTEAEKEAARLRRQLSKAQRNNAKLYAELEVTRRTAPPTDPQPRTDGDDPPPTDPRDLDRLVEQRAAERLEAQRINERCNAVAAEGQKLEGFGEALQTVAAEAGPLFDQRGKPTPLMEEILEAEAPAALLHHLGKNPDLAAELADLNPRQLARRLDRIEREMAAASKTQVSAAPKPLAPVKPTGSAVKSESQMSDAEWYASRRAQQR